MLDGIYLHIEKGINPESGGVAIDTLERWEVTVTDGVPVKKCLSTVYRLRAPSALFHKDEFLSRSLAITAARDADDAQQKNADWYRTYFNLQLESLAKQGERWVTEAMANDFSSWSEAKTSQPRPRPIQRGL